MHDFTGKSSFFMLLGAFRLKRSILVVVVGVWASLNLASCGSSKKTNPPSGLEDRVLVSQGVSAAATFGRLEIINGFNDTLTGVPALAGGSSPGMMAISPARNIAVTFDSSSNSVFAVNTTNEASLGQIHLPGPTFSMVVPTSDPVGYAAVPTATISGFPVLGAVEVMNLSAGAITSTIAVKAAQTVVSNSNGSQFLVFSNDSNSVAVLTPARSLPGVDLSCTPSNLPNAECQILTGFDRPVNAVTNGTTAYVLNCGAECGGVQSSIQVLDLSTPTPTLVGAPVKVNGATSAFLSGTKLYVAGNGTPTGQMCSALTNSINPKTAATFCGTLDIVDTTTMTNPYFGNPGAEIAIPDGYHRQMDMSINGQLFVGSTGCTNVGNVNNPNGEVRGCLAIYNTNNNTLVIPPDNGDVNGLQSFTSRQVEYVAEGGNLRVYDTTRNILLINDFIPLGTITVVGYVGDVKAIDFF
jgi:hypothetical protein